MFRAMSSTAPDFGPIIDDIDCVLAIDGVSDELRVGSFEAVEAISQLFAYRIVIATAPSTVDSLEGSLGKATTLTVSRNGTAERVVHGILTEVIPDGAFIGTDQARTVLLLEPALAGLRYSGGFRIFQNMTVKDIVTKLLAQENVDAKWTLRPDAPVRDYRTQLDESDFDFMSRLLADEGIHYSFDLAEGATTVLFTNNPLGYSPLDGKNTFVFNGNMGAVTTEHVRSIKRAQRVRTGSFLHRDYDFTKPALLLEGTATSTAPQTQRQWRDYPGSFDILHDGAPRAEMRLQELRSDSSTMTGTANTLRFVVGKQFTVSGHPDAGFNKTLLLTKVAFGSAVSGAFKEQGGGPKGSRAAVGLVQFQAVLSDAPIRPARRRKPPSRLQTAIVVGATPLDPQVDLYGRIHVQFRWDLDGQMNEHSSCAIRMATPSAHDDEGFWFAHRIGTEVLVDFIDGDIDRPVVVGALYNATVLQPYALPGNVTRSVWKNHTIPYDASAFNEIRYENKAGSEEIYIHAQKDETEQVLHDHNKTVGNDHTATVGNNQTLEVKNDQTITIDHDETVTVKHNQGIAVTNDRGVTVGGNHSVSVTGNETNSVQQNRSSTITGNESLTVMGSATKMVAGSDSLSIIGARTLTAMSESVSVATSRSRSVGGDDTTNVAGGRTQAISGDDTINVGGARQTTVAKDEALTLSQSYAIKVTQDFSLSVGDGATITINKDGSIVLKTGEASLTMGKDGTISIKGKSVAHEASSDMTVKGDNVTVKGSSGVGIN
jgi:type VI secretion system secreted protein VgrG